MTREEYLRELETAGNELQSKVRELAVAANPLNQLRSEVARDWKWWLPGASVAGFAVARFLRTPRGRVKFPAADQAAAGSGAAFWVPVVLKLLPATLTQLVPLFLSLRSGRKD